MADARRTAKEAICYAEAGFSLFKLNGKHPAIKGYDWTTAEYLLPDEVEKIFSEWQGNVGVKLGARDLVVDVDPRNFKEGDKPHVRLFKDAGIDVKNYASLARTGGGGIHIYFRLPKGAKVKKKNKAYPGIDFLSEGHYVVGVGSIHPDSGKPYEWAGGLDLRGIKEAPQTLLEIIKPVEVEVLAQNQSVDEGSTDGDAEVVQRYVEFLKDAPPAIEGSGGDQTTFQVACKGRDLGLSRVKTFELMFEHYNHRCVPDWKPEELETKVRNAFNYAVALPGNALPTADFKEVKVTARHPLFRGWDRMASGKLAKTLNNAFNFFILPDSPLLGTIAYDELSGQVKILKPLPWLPGPLPPGGAEWSDGDTIQLTLWMSREREFDVKSTVVDQAVLAAAQLTLLHPIKDYLRGLQWDGTPRLETWLIDLAGAEDNRFVREASKKFLLQAVSRVYRPGCKADHVVVLEGPQGVGKSSLVEILGGPWYGDIIIDPHARDTVDAMRGKWFIEFSEMDPQNRHDAQAMKAFITRKVDRVRLAYGRRAIDLPRQCVFVGTMNPDATGEYLQDATGNRRWWPVEIRQVKFAELQASRDQLFAEAVNLVLSGEATHIIDQEVVGLALEAQRARQTTDPWGVSISEFLEGKKETFITGKDVWVYALKGNEAAFTVGHQRRIAACLKEFGYVPRVRRDPFNKRHVVRGFCPADMVMVDDEEMFS